MDDLLNKVKIAIGVTGTYLDSTITIYVNEVKEYLRSAGVPEDVIDSKKTVGVIARGVSDLWNYGAGKAELSAYFMQRTTQLVMESKGDDSDV